MDDVESRDEGVFPAVRLQERGQEPGSDGGDAAAAPRDVTAPAAQTVHSAAEPADAADAAFGANRNGATATAIQSRSTTSSNDVRSSFNKQLSNQTVHSTAKSIL